MLNKELLRQKILEAVDLGYIVPVGEDGKIDSWGFNFTDTAATVDYHEFLEIGVEQFYTKPHCNECDEIHKEVSKEILNSPLWQALR